MKVNKVSEFMLSRLRQGYYTFTLSDAENATGFGANTRQAIYRLVRQGWLFSPSKGFYVIIDPQHQASGFMPVEWFIDDWMRHLGGNYYLGMLTAAMIHGASHQKPQQIQIVCDKEFEFLEKGNYQISFFYKRTIQQHFCEQRKSPAGYFTISNPELTAYDILRYSRACPSLNLAATILQELGENISPERLAALLDSGTEVAVLQRLGWLLDYTGWTEKTALLVEKLQSRQVVWRPMRTDLPKDGDRDPKWHIIVNVEIELDL